MKFEDLPNEILIECFEYLNAFDLFHSFDELNDRFYQLIRHIRLYLNLEDVNKSIFDEFCTIMSLNPTIKTQIYSLYFPLDPREFQTKQFFSLFSSDEFINVEKYGFIIPSLFAPDYSASTIPTPMSIPLPKTIRLRTLSVIHTDYPFNVIPSIINLTIDQCNLTEFLHLLKSFPQMKYFRIQRTDERDHISENEQWTHQHLKQLIIDYFRNSFDDLQIYLKFLPNLKSLTISSFNNEQFIDAKRWEELIKLFLPRLKAFRFVYSCDQSNDSPELIESFDRFRSNFWHEHQWFMEYIIEKYLSILYTIPYSSETLILAFENNNTSNCSDKNVHNFTNVTNLFLYGTLSSDSSKYYFPNVTSLTTVTPKQSDVSKYFDYLKKSICLFNLKHLDVEQRDHILNMLFLKAAPQLKSLSIDWKTMASLLNDVNLCRELKRLIKRLDIYKSGDQTFDKSFYRDGQLRETFRDLEHLICQIDHVDHVIYFLHNFPRLSTLNIRWKSSDDPQEHLVRLDVELERFNVIHDVNIQHCITSENRPKNYWDVNIRVWVGKNDTLTVSLLNK